jgi:hypothetical protein
MIMQTQVRQASVAYGIKNKFQAAYEAKQKSHKHEAK